MVRSYRFVTDHRSTPDGQPARDRIRGSTPKGQRARGRILAAAEALFATHGFHGTSMRDIAAAAKQPLASTMYHFARKEQLYGSVLTAIGDELLAELARARVHAAHAARVDVFAAALVRWSVRNPGRVRLVMRELIDNGGRIARASRLPMAPLLDEAARMVGAGSAYPELAVLHVIGGISYVVAAKPTVDRMVGATRARQLAKAYEAEAIAFARRVLSPLEGGHQRPAAPRRLRGQQA